MMSYAVGLRVLDVKATSHYWALFRPIITIALLSLLCQVGESVCLPHWCKENGECIGNGGKRCKASIAVKSLICEPHSAIHLFFLSIICYTEQNIRTAAVTLGLLLLPMPNAT